MIRAVIVDDEKWVRLSLREQADWQGLGIEIAGEAQNGEVAIEIIEKVQPDIVITDMHMPKKSGIDLMEYIHNKYPRTIIIVISGYSEFEYAQKAIMYNAFDYILKPIEEEILENTLKKAVARLNEYQNNEELKNLKVKLNKNKNYVKEKILTDIISGLDIKSEDVSNNLQDCSILFSDVKKTIIVFDTVNFDQIVLDIYENDFYLASFALLNIIGELTQKEENSLLFRNCRKPNELILIASSEKIRRNYRRTCSILENVISNVKKYINFNIYIGIGSDFNSITDVNHAYLKTLEVIKNAGMISEKGIIWTDEVSKRNVYYKFSENRKKAFSIYVKSCSDFETNELINKLFEEFSQNKSLNLESIRNAILELKVVLDNALGEYNSSTEKLLGKQNINSKVLNDFFTFDQLKSWFKDVVFKAIYYIREHKKSEGKKTIDEIANYVDNNYCEKISLTSIAEKFYINTTYLSRIFKAETGYNFSDYLNKTRMNIAASLIENHDMKMKDISDMVGFDNVNYFFKKFKDYYGCTPTEFKEIKKNSEL